MSEPDARHRLAAILAAMGWAIRDLGDVLEKADGSVYGDGVNIAARLQALCQHGGVMAGPGLKPT